MQTFRRRKYCLRPPGRLGLGAQLPGIDGGGVGLAVVQGARLAGAERIVAGEASVVVGAPGMTFRREPAVYIPAGVPGLDHAGHVVRTDAVASLPLAALRKTALPRAAEVLAAIETRGLASKEQGRC